MLRPKTLTKPADDDAKLAASSVEMTLLFYRG